MQIYIVQQGDSVDAIAGYYGVSVESVLYANQLVYPYRLAVGQALLIDTGENTAGKMPLAVNGYAYPFISTWVLEQTLPYLTELSVFSYGFTADGNLIFPALDDTWMIQLAEEYNTRAILTLTPFGPDGQFNNNLISAVVNQQEAQDRLVEQLLQVMDAKGFAGLDIDFEYIRAEDRDAFTTFVGNTTKQMNARGYQVSVALAPKTSSEQQGLLYEGKDYGGLGAAANYVLLMTYEWGYTLPHECYM